MQNLNSLFKKLKLIIPVKYKPKKIMIVAMILENICDLLKRKDPNKVEEAPRRIKINEKPRTKRTDLCNMKYLDFFCRFSKFVPQIKERQPGISGRTHGDKKLIIPAKKLKKKRDINQIPSNLSNFPSEFN